MKSLPYVFAGLVMAAGLTVAGINLGKSDVSDWSTTAADNDDADSAIDFAENQTPASLNNSSRALMQQIRQWAEQTESQNLYAGTTGNTATNAISITPTVVPSSLTEGAMYFFKSPTTNTGAVTLQVASQTAASILKENDTALAAGDIENNQIVMVVYDGNNFQMINPSAIASTIDITLDTAPVLGADLGLGGFNIDFPTTANVDDVIDDDTMAAADANNLATAESIKAYVDSQDHTGVTTGTANQISPYATNTTDAGAHGLTRVDFIHAELECINTGGCNGNWAFGDRVATRSGMEGGSTEPAFYFLIDDTNLTIITNASNTPRLINKTTRAGFSITAGNWAMTITPYAR